MKKNTYTLSIDMLGSETKVKDIIKGLNQSYLRNLNYKFKLFGNKKEILHFVITIVMNFKNQFQFLKL